MAVTAVSICNFALQKVGGDAITAVDDTSVNGARCNDLYEYIRDDLLRGHTWNFATRMVELTVNGTAPVMEFDYAHDLPADWLRTITVHDNDAGLGALQFLEMEVDATRVLATNSEDVYLKYVYQHVTEARWPADFVMAMQLALARDLAVPVANSNTLEERLDRQAATALRKAKSSDALTNPPPRRPLGSWVTSRYSWPSTRWPR